MAADPPRLHGEWQGGASGAGISVIVSRSTARRRAALHRHPYPETFIVRQGQRALHGRRRADRGQRRTDDRGAGQHAAQIHQSGPGPLETTDIHENGTFVTEWLE